MISNRNTPLENTQIEKLAPSVFAPAPYWKQSSRYAFVPTSVILEGMRSNGYLPFQASQSRTRIEDKQNFTKHILRFRQAGAALQNVGDSALEVVLVNSHDGTSCYELMLGAFRLVCSNGLIVAESLVQSVKIRHTGNILDEVISGTQSLIEHAPEVDRAIREWKQIMLSPVEQKLFAEQALTLRFDEDAPIPAEKLLTVRRSQDNGNDLWSTFNRVQENAVRGGVRYLQSSQTPEGHTDVRRNRTREVKGIDQNTKLNRALWTLAQKMAELKAA